VAPSSLPPCPASMTTVVKFLGPGRWPQTSRPDEDREPDPAHDTNPTANMQLNNSFINYNIRVGISCNYLVSINTYLTKCQRNGLITRIPGSEAKSAAFSVTISGIPSSIINATNCKSK
jgi:hypothetical protein